MNRNTSIAIFASLAILVYLLFGNSLLEFFRTEVPDNNVEVQAMEDENTVTSQDLVIGEGTAAEAGTDIAVHYIGRLTDGTVFDSSLDRGVPFIFTLGVGQVIRGWDEGLVGMRVGGRRLLTIPPEYAYGDQEVGPIPANSTLIFEVELLGVDGAESTEDTESVEDQGS